MFLFLLAAHFSGVSDDCSGEIIQRCVLNAALQNNVESIKPSTQSCYVKTSETHVSQVCPSVRINFYRPAVFEGLYKC